ncbi:uncharacterized protein N7503_003444 [Penicillium pulvis]|uniref:uncharacterized protein n=1 Tax=Penicillium pulvis TaxID=1562058 RepID=UPI0025474436|nr:uncharacterized protein N7503_003444 [Penicillium pulvis]KAJ5805842.1 hypothetical protein N7503_003444 [Penicillium pulvis]
MSLQKHPIIKRPILLERLPRDHDPNDIWSPYPRQAAPQPAHTNCVINGVFDLMLIVWEICDYFFGDNKPEILELEKVNAFHYRLQNWADSLPECIILGCNALPGVMDMHMRYYTVILVMFGFVEANVIKGDLESKRRIKTLKLDAAYNIGTLINLFRLEWPAECVPGTAMQYCSVAMFTLLENLDDAQNKQVFVECFIVLRALARRWQLAKGILRLIQLTAMKMEAALPTEMENLFKDFEADLWKVEDSRKFSSLYPNFSVAVNQQKGSEYHQEEAELDRFLASWDNIDLAETVMGQATEARDASNDSSGNSRK